MQDIYEKATIFVSIASYRDPEIKKTIASLRQTAKFPDRVRVGVLSQLRLPDDNHLIVGSSQGITEQLVADTDSTGVGWARNKILTTMYAQEDFVLQIDSHMRFDQDWDVKALEQFYSLDNPRSVLSCYPTPYDPSTGVLQPMQMSYFTCTDFNGWGLPVIRASAKSMDKIPPLPSPTAFIAAGALFMPRAAAEQVLYDPYYTFSGEELSYSIRLWTHGFDLYCYNAPFLWHSYGHDNGRPIVWEDNKELVPSIAKGAARVRALIGLDGAFDSDVIKDLGIYGLGSMRSLLAYSKFAGLDFEKRQVKESTKKGIF